MKMKWFLALLVVGLLAAVPVSAQTINEINYDDDGIDHEEYVEIYAAGGGDYSNYDLVFYNGSSGAVYKRVNLGTIPGDGYLVIGVAGVPNVDIEFATGSDEIQNGAPDGLAIVRISPASCDQFLSYEGTFAAVGGECDGITSTDIGVADIDPSGPEGDVVLQRVPNETGDFEQTGDGVANGVAEDGTPGEVNAAGPPAAHGKLTSAGVSGGAVTVDLCASGGDPPYTYTIESLPTLGTLSDNNGAIGPVPDDVVGTLTYTPGSVSGLDTFDFTVTDSNTLTSLEATQEVAVQENTVVISEIMHSPSLNDQIYEFVEIYNTSASAVTLTRLDTRPEEDVDTTDNLSASIGAGEMKIIAIDSTTNGEGFELDKFLCEWRLSESDIIRIPYSKWEFMGSSPHGSDCAASTGSRVLLFGTGGALLDAVDLAALGAADCDQTSYGVDGFFLDPDPLDTLNNDDPLNWACSSDLSDGRREGEISEIESATNEGDTASPGYVPTHKESHTYEDSCFGACCLTNGDCVDGVDADECLALRCDIAGGYYQGDNCGAVGGTCSAQADEDKKCCLPTGTCEPAGECECIQLNGNWDGETTCAIDPYCEPSNLVINELEYDSPGTDDAEYIEIHGPTGGQSLAGWSLEFFNGNDLSGDNIYRTVDLSVSPGGTMPMDKYLVVGSANVPEVDLIAWESNGIQNGPEPGDGVVLLFNNEVIEAMSYATTSGFTAVGGQADGTFLTPIVPTDGASTTLQKIPDAGEWTETFNNTPGLPNYDGGEAGACCDIVTYECTVTLPEDCTTVGVEFKGLGTDCDPNPCIPTGACCLPDGSCVSNVYEDTCVNVLGGSWLGDGVECPDSDHEAFIGCLDGPEVAVTGDCLDWDLSEDGDVDLEDFALYQQLDQCPMDPVGACCIPNGECEVITEWECAGSYGPDAYQGDDVACESVSCPPPTPGSILINEVWADDPGGDDNEFIELYGTPSASLGGYSLIIVDGDTGGDATSAVYRVVNFRADFVAQALDVNGYYVMGTGPDVAAMADDDLDVVFGNNNSQVDDIQNGSQTYALVLTEDIEYCTSSGVPDASCTGSANQLTDASVANITSDAIDTVATRTGLFDDVYFYAPLVQDSGYYPFDYGQRIPNGTDTNTADDWETIYGNEMGDPADPSTPGAANVAQGTIPGACCLDEECQELLVDECASTNGVWMGHGTTCTPFNPCECGSIAEAEARGEVPVCIENAVVSSTEDFVYSSSYKDFYIQDTVGTNGVQVFGDTTVIDGLQVTDGDLIDITGTLELYYGYFELTAPFTVTKHGNLGVPTPYDTTPDLYQAISARGDDLTACLVVLPGVTFADAGGTFAGGRSYNVSADGGTTNVVLYTSTQSLTGETIPSGPQDVVGIFKAYSTYYELLPRTIADITPAK